MTTTLSLLDPPVLADLDSALSTERLELRPYTEADVEDIWPWVSDPAFPRNMSWSANTHRDETIAWIRSLRDARAANQQIVWAIVHGSRVVGSIGLHDAIYAKAAIRLDSAELGYWLAPPLWGQGLMTEAAAAVLVFGFAQMRLHKVVVRCLERNAASRRVIEKLGFRAVGRREEDVFRDGEWLAHLEYEMLAREHEDATSTRRFQRGR